MTTEFARHRVEERLDEALAAARGQADGVELLFRGREANLMRLAEARVVQASDVVQGQVTVRAVVDGAAAVWTTSDLSAEGLAGAVAQAIRNARVTPQGREPITLPSAAAVPAAPAWSMDPVTATLDTATKTRWLEPALRAAEADDLALAGRFHSGRFSLAVRSTEGVATWHQGSYADLALSALERPVGHRASAWRAHFDARVDAERVAALEAEVRAECRRGRDPVAVRPGAWDVVLSPAAVAELLEWLGEIGFSSRAVEDGSSFLTGNVGSAVTGAAVSLHDDGAMPHAIGLPLPFDAEGQPKQRVVLVEDGVARGSVHDSRSARRAGCAATGHAHADALFPAPGSKACHLHMAGGDSDLEGLLGQVDRGLFITRLHYVNGLIEPRRAVMTGLTRDGAFLVEGGRLGRAIEPMRFTDSILEAFARIPGRAGLSRAVESHAGGFGTESCHVAPWVLVRGLQFTSGR